MEAEQKAELENVGINVDAALNRFMGKEAMLRKFFTRFLSDQSYAAMLEAMNSGAADAAKAAAHQLKSVCGTIGCENMQARVTELESQLKAGNFPEAQKILPEIESQYAQICSALNKLLEA